MDLHFVPWVADIVVASVLTLGSGVDGVEVTAWWPDWWGEDEDDMESTWSSSLFLRMSDEAQEILDELSSNCLSLCPLSRWGLYKPIKRSILVCDQRSKLKLHTCLFWSRTLRSTVVHSGPTVGQGWTIDDWTCAHQGMHAKVPQEFLLDEVQTITISAGRNTEEIVYTPDICKLTSLCNLMLMSSLH